MPNWQCVIGMVQLIHLALIQADNSFLVAKDTEVFIRRICSGCLDQGILDAYLLLVFSFKKKKKSYLYTLSRLSPNFFVLLFFLFYNYMFREFTNSYFHNRNASYNLCYIIMQITVNVAVGYVSLE